MSAHVLLNLLKSRRGLSSIYLFFATSFIKSIMQEHTCKILFIIHVYDDEITL